MELSVDEWDVSAVVRTILPKGNFTPLLQPRVAMLHEGIEGVALIYYNENQVADQLHAYDGQISVLSSEH